MENMDGLNVKTVSVIAAGKKGSNNSYWGNIFETVTTLWTGLKLTLLHFTNARKRWYPLGVKDEKYYVNDSGVFTVRYPHELLPVPDNGRYKLHNEIEDCIVCDKCANICPVDCIEIESIRAVKEFGRTSDGTPRKIHAARFDIDMAKCCYCGLCTTVCPTECLTMTKEFDFAEYEIRNHIFSFARMSPDEITLKKNEWEVFEKGQQKAQAGGQQPSAKPMMKPRIGPSLPPAPPAQPSGQSPEGQLPGTGTGSSAPMKFKPKIKLPGQKQITPMEPEKTGELKSQENFNAEPNPQGTGSEDIPDPEKTEDKN